MLSNNSKITELKYENTIAKLARIKNITLAESAKIISGMSFSDYMTLLEANVDIIPPSGQPVGQPKTNIPAPTQPGAPAQPGQPVQPTAPGQPAPPKQGTNQIPGQPPQPGQPPAGEQVAEDGENKDLARLKQLAGIKENCSSGATGAGSIAVAPAAMGTMQKRKPPVEESPSLEHQDIGRKSVVGDTKPNQATGKLSANLAARNKKTASRTDNGLRR